MPKSPLCARCEVCKGVGLNIAKYQFFQRLVEDSPVERLTDHARGFMHGQLSVLAEVMEDFSDLVPYIEIERQLTMNGKGE